MKNAENSGVPAGVMRRGSALMVDIAVFGILVSMLGFSGIWQNSGWRSKSALSADKTPVISAVADANVQALRYDAGEEGQYGGSYNYWRASSGEARVAVILWVLYCGFMLWRFGATPGKMLLKIKVVDAATGGALGADKAFTRSVYSLLSAGTLLIGYFWAFGEKRMTWHDMIPGTKVVRS